MRTLLVSATTAFFLLYSLCSPAEQARDPLIQAAADIRMTDEQKAAFQSNLEEFMDDVASATRKLLRRNNETNVMKKIVRKRKQLLNSMDRKMAKVLTEEQYPRYEAYRDLFYASISGRLGTGDKETTTGFSTMMGSANQGT